MKRRNLKLLIFKIAAIILFTAANILFSSSPLVALYKWMKVLEFGLLGFYVTKTKPGFSDVVFPLSIGILYSSVIAIVQFILQHAIGGSLWFLGERTFSVATPGIAQIDLGPSLGLRLRAYGTFPHPNVLAGFLVAMLPMVIYIIIQPVRPALHRYAQALAGRPIIQSDQWKRSLYIFVVAAGVLALVFTFSRSAWVVFGVAIALTIARIRNKELRITKKTIFVLSIVLLFLVFIPTSYFLLHNSTDESVVVRQQLNASAITLWQKSPLIGVGLGNFLIRLPEALPSRQIYFLQPVHNMYLLLLSEIGVVGVGLIVWFVWCISQATRGERRGTGTQEATRILFRLSLVSCLLLGLVDHWMFTLQQGQLLLTTLLAFSISGGRRMK